MTSPHELVTIDTLAHGGDGVGRLPDGRVIFVPRVIPGEQVRVSITRSKSSHAFGALEELEQASSARKPPGCEHFERCGGCQLRHIQPEDALKFKGKAVYESIRRIARQEELPEPVLHASPIQDGWRTRATLHARATRLGMVIGFMEARSHRIIDLSECPQLHPALEQTREHLASWLGGKVESCEIFMETASDTEVVVSLRKLKRLRGATLVDFLEATRVFMQRAEVPVRGVWVGKERVGDPSVDAAAALKLPTPLPESRLPAGLFRQANMALNAKLVERVAQLASAGSPQLIWDLFAGCGNLTFTLATTSGAKVIGVESERDSVRRGLRLADELGVFERVDFVQHDLFIDGALEVLHETPATVAVLDPPRVGAKETCESLAAFKHIKRVVYVSCEPSKLGRDMQVLLEGGFKVSALECFDMFPQTSHMEVVAVFDR